MFYIIKHYSVIAHSALNNYLLLAGLFLQSYISIMKDKWDI